MDYFVTRKQIYSFINVRNGYISKKMLIFENNYF